MQAFAELNVELRMIIYCMSMYKHYNMKFIFCHYIFFKKMLTSWIVLCYIITAMEAVFFACLKFNNPTLSWQAKKPIGVLTPTKIIIGGGSCASKDNIGMY